jgi:ribosome-associated heat shock protein Hsp15
MSESANNSSIRLDKWLWAARFYKTRSLATEAVRGGKVQVNDERTKPSRELKVGERIRIRRGVAEMTVIVQGLNPRRGPAEEAQKLYEETSASLQQRRREASIRQQTRPGGAPDRPTKRDRRELLRLKRRGSESESS